MRIRFADNSMSVIDKKLHQPFFELCRRLHIEGRLNGLFHRGKIFGAFLHKLLKNKNES